MKNREEGKMIKLTDVNLYPIVEYPIIFVDNFFWHKKLLIDNKS